MCDWRRNIDDICTQLHSRELILERCFIEWLSKLIQLLIEYILTLYGEDRPQGESVFTDNFVYDLSILLTSFTAIPIWQNLLTKKLNSSINPPQSIERENR